MRKICFVCTGNTCRSPMAEKFLKQHLENMKIKGVSVCSLGISVEHGEAINQNTVIALKNYGIRCGKRLAKQLSNKDILKEDCFFITMTEEQKKAFLNQQNVFTIGELVGGGDIPDPYGQSIEQYKAVAKILFDYTYKIAQNLKQLKD